MKVLLTQSVAGLGVKGQVHEVSEGYFRNNLQKKKLAVPYNSALHAQHQRARELQNKKKIKKNKKRNQLLDRIHRTQITISKKANSGGTLYSAITANEVGDALKEKGVQVSNARLKLKNPLKRTGVFSQMLTYDGSNVNIKVNVEPE